MRHFRPAAIEDVPPLAALMARAFDPRYGEGWNGSQLLGTLSLAGTRTDVAISDGTPSGFTLTRFTGEECELLLIAVEPDLRGQGIGTDLLNRSIEKAKQSSTQRMFLEVRAENILAIRLYERHGFVGIGQRKDYYVGSDNLRYDAMTMTLTL